MSSICETLLSLSVKCRLSVGPNRLLDAEISSALCRLIYRGHTARPVLSEPGVIEDDAGQWRAPQYTSSLDAAVQIVPLGHSWALYGGEREEEFATAYVVPDGGKLPWPDWVNDFTAETAALAMCGAALLAQYWKVCEANEKEREP